MSRLFTEPYIDEEVSALLAKLLRSRRVVVVSAQEAGMLGCSDEEQLAHAASQRKALLTHNRVHFEALVQQYYATGRTHCGVIIAVRRPPYEILKRLLRLLDQLTADEMENQVTTSEREQLIGPKSVRDGNRIDSGLCFYPRFAGDDRRSARAGELSD